MKLEDLRKIIDEIDLSILNLVAQRMDLSRKIREIKNKSDIGILDKKREKTVRQNWHNKAKQINLDKRFTDKLLDLILKESKKIQKL